MQDNTETKAARLYTTNTLHCFGECNRTFRPWDGLVRLGHYTPEQLWEMYKTEFFQSYDPSNPTYNFNTVNTTLEQDAILTQWKSNAIPFSRASCAISSHALGGI